jgi:hypothetical protein
MTDLEKRTQELRFFVAPATFADVPRSIVVIVAGLCVGYSLLLSWWTGLLLAVLLFPALIRMHRGDPAAAYVWIAALKSRATCIDPSLTARAPITLE